MRAALTSRLLATAARLRALPSDESGNVIIYVSVSVAVMLGFVGLALDASRAMITHSEAQAAADAAALAGASQLDQQTGACGRAQAEANNAVVNQARFAQGGLANVSLASATCLSSLPNSDDASTSGLTTTDDVASKYIQVTTNQLTHQNTFLAAENPNTTATIQRTAVAGFRRSLCAAAPVMSSCTPLSWTAGVALNAWFSGGANGAYKGWLNANSCNNANCVHDELASVTPSFCVVDSSLAPATGNKTNKAADGINVRFGQGNNSDPPPDSDVVDFSAKSPTTKQAYSNDINGGTGWNCSQYLQDYHKSDSAFASHFSTCTTTETSTSRYSVYQAERADGKIPTKWKPPSGLPTTTAERRLVYLAVFNCGTGAPPQYYLKAFLLAPADGQGSPKTAWVEPIGIATSKTDPTAIHEEVQLYR